MGGGQFLSEVPLQLCHESSLESSCTLLSGDLPSLGAFLSFRTYLWPIVTPQNDTGGSRFDANSGDTTPCMGGMM